MALRRLTEECKGGKTCPGVWEHDQYPDDFLVVGTGVDQVSPPLGPGEKVVRVSKTIIRAALEA